MAVRLEQINKSRRVPRLRLHPFQFTSPLAGLNLLAGPRVLIQPPAGADVALLSGEVTLRAGLEVKSSLGL